MNPGDHGTRGLTPLDTPTQWLEPSEFLSTPQNSWNFTKDSDQICSTQAAKPQPPAIEVGKFSTESTTQL